MITTLVYRDHRLSAVNPPVDTLAALRAEPGVMLWVDLSAPTPEEVQLVLEQVFAFHPLVIEDCTADSPFPKLEDYDDYLYFIMHAVDYTQRGAVAATLPAAASTAAATGSAAPEKPVTPTAAFATTELDLLLGKTFLVTFHKRPLKPVQAALDRAQRTPQQPVRGPDRFAHTLLDLMVEAYKPALDALRVALARVEGDVLRGAPADELFPAVVALRKELSQLRQIVRPQRAIAHELAQGKNRFIRPLLVPYLRDLTEDLARIEAQSQTWAEQLILSFRVYLNRSSHQANEGIRVLTGLTALTIPVLLVGGWFGMNFAHMPWLDSQLGYLAAAVLTLGGTFGMLFWMRRKRWL